MVEQGRQLRLIPLIKPSIKDSVEDFVEEFRGACDNYRSRFIEFFGNDGGFVIGVKPSGIFFASLLLSYLRDNNVEKLNFMLTDKDGGELEENETALMGRKILVVDGKILPDGLTAKRIRSVLGNNQILYTVWDNRGNSELADVVLNKINYITAFQASQILGIHPESFTRLCREGKIPGTLQKRDGWVVDEDKLNAFQQTYSAKVSRPKKSFIQK